MTTFEWDPAKATVNARKHRVTFEEARTVFYDEAARIIDDPDHSASEDRFVILGVSERLRLLVVCHCYRQSDTVIRIISARRANAEERAVYEEFKP
jgi:uncharacterized DUF497 family protein